MVQSDLRSRNNFAKQTNSILLFGYIPESIIKWQALGTATVFNTLADQFWSLLYFFLYNLYSILSIYKGRLNKNGSLNNILVNFF